ncbi:hypothetical protein [Xanthobacter flavus]|uniref:hypothetical protein n=1 Tax=Xanthobacter flavus TaxID=281 RepID=UPI001AE20740|nr:hypothetical protein [Xanthobacter flavus]MBP2149964.1 hypothetical protein [Xanthobacter flavus]
MARERIAKTGMAPGGRPVWTAREMALLAVIYPDYTRALKVLERRTLAACRFQARAMGLVTRLHMWTGSEEARLRRLYPVLSGEALLAAFPGLTLQKIGVKAGGMGLKKKRKPYNNSGFPAIDQIRNRAFELNISMSDLDSMAGTKTYFRRGGWIGRPKPNYRAIGRAAEALDGLVAVRWSEGS